MLTIKDLHTSKQLDSKEMANVTGGYGYGMPASFNIESAVNAPKAASIMGLAESFTGAQLNTNLQTDDDFSSVIGSGQAVNAGGNINMTSQSAFSSSSNFTSSVQ